MLGEYDEEDILFGMHDKKHVPKRLTETNNFDKCVARDTVHNFYAQKGTVPITVTLLAKTRWEHWFLALEEFLGTLDVGGRWRGQTDNNRQINEAEVHPVLFEDIHGGHTRLKNLADRSDSPDVSSFILEEE